ncbi:MAG: FAD-dependent oxidoreductase [Halioglobus sp.]
MSVETTNTDVYLSQASIEPQPIVVIGAGPVGVRAIQELRKADPTLPLVLYGDENYEPYNRIQLSGLLAGQHKVPDIALAEGLLNDSCRMTHFRRRRIESIDTRNRKVTDSQGNQQVYRKLILATGSRPFIPAVTGIELPGVFTFRNMSDAEKLSARRVHSTHTVVLGAGLLGIEAARAMQRHNTEVTLIDHNSHPMYRQLDNIAGSLLANELMEQRIQLRLDASIRMLIGSGRVEGVVLRDGSNIVCDTVIVATGIKPNLDLARAAGLSFGRGITVNSQMQTSDPCIYAIGECCEFEGQVFGLVAPGYEQATIAASNIVGDNSLAHYSDTQLATSLKAAGLTVFSMGETQHPTSTRTLSWQGNKQYRSIAITRGRISSINAIGDWHELPALRELAKNRKWIAPWRMWQFTRNGKLLPESQALDASSWPASTIICNCNAVSCGQLKSAIAAGSNTSAELGAATQAGTGCGSCQPLLLELLGDTAPLKPVVGFRTLSSLTSVALGTALLALIISVAYPETVQLTWRWDEIWRNETYKQFSGFTILGLTLLSLIFSMRKRITRFSFGNFAWWRVAHVFLTVAVLAVLAIHTGFRLGDNLNLILISTFLALVLAGALLGLTITFEHRLAPARARQLRSWGIWSHVLLSWPLPALLGMHILKSYYF